MRKFIWYLLLVFLTTLEKFVNSKRLCMVSNRPLKLGLRGFLQWLISLFFYSSAHDSTLFVQITFVGRILLSLYIDDMIIRDAKD